MAGEASGGAETGVGVRIVGHRHLACLHGGTEGTKRQVFRGFSSSTAKKGGGYGWGRHRTVSVAGEGQVAGKLVGKGVSNELAGLGVAIQWWEGRDRDGVE